MDAEPLAQWISARLPARTTDLMEAARRQGRSAADVREAVWAMLDDGDLELQPDRTLIAPRAGTPTEGGTDGR